MQELVAFKSCIANNGRNNNSHPMELQCMNLCRVQMDPLLKCRDFLQSSRLMQGFDRGMAFSASFCVSESLACKVETEESSCTPRKQVAQALWGFPTIGDPNIVP